jgi:hypothetical protein
LDYLKKNPPSVSTAHLLVLEILYLWILLPLCEVPILQKMLQSKINFTYKYLVICFLVVENHGQDSKDDNKLRPISCFIEGAIHNILLHVDDAQNVCFPFLLYFIIYIDIIF